MTRRSLMCLLASGSLFSLSIGKAQDTPSARDVETCLSRVLDYHGHLGPWAVIGYRVGERALKESGLPRSTKDLVVVHYCPEAVQYTCMLDGLHAATGASIGKLTLQHKVVPADQLHTIVVDGKHCRRFQFTVNPELVSSILNLDHEHQISEARRVAGLADEKLFRVTVVSEK
ncbi:MAG: formylmethanofuran dehydrogenase subunit E family protein [Isosphaeraceae bacterium]